MNKYIDAEKLIAEIKRYKNKADNRLKIQGRTFAEEQKDVALQNLCGNLLHFITSLQQEQPKSKIIKVRCVYPYDKTWEEGKTYTCKVWHHGDFNRDFWDVYYDYGKDPRYVQFPTIELLNEEFAIIPEQPEHPVIHPHYTKVCETETGRVFLAEYSSEAAEWYEAGTGKAYSISDVEIIKEQPEVDLVAELKHHLATTPKEQLEKEWKELEPYSNIGPTVQEFLYGKQPEVDLMKALDDYYNKAEFGPEDAIEYETHKSIARHFYELGQRTKYQQDRAEFAKLKAKEWQDGYDEGYAKGLNARKEE